MKKCLTYLRSLDLTISAIILAMIFVNILIQVYSRLAPVDAPRWTVEMGSILLCALLWMGLGSGVQSNSHIRFDMLISMFSGKTRKFFDLVGNIFFAVFLIILSFYTMKMLLWYMKTGATTTFLEWNKGWSKMPMFIGLAVASLRLVHVIIASIAHFNDEPGKAEEGNATEDDDSCRS